MDSRTDSRTTRVTTISLFRHAAGDKNSLLNAKHLVQKQLEAFVEERLMPSQEHQRKIKFHDPLPKNKARTFSDLYNVSRKGAGKEQILKADRNILERLVTSYEAGRQVDLPKISKHELMPVPLSLAETNGSLRVGDKSLLVGVLTSQTTCPANIRPTGSSCLIIDGPALVQSLGKPTGAKTFGDLADAYIQAVLRVRQNFDRIDVIFDRHYDVSIESATQERWNQLAQPTRKKLEDRTVPLPINWKNFLALPQNKADLARFLSQQLIEKVPQEIIIVVAGGFDDEDEVQCTNPSIDVSSLKAKHEEADTRLILHCLHSESQDVVVSARDTDILVLLLAHFNTMPCTNLWMKCGTALKPKYIPIHEIINDLPDVSSALESLLAFHALTGCDSVSYIAGHSKKTAWKIFQQHHQLLKDLGRGELNQETITAAEKFICRIYGLEEVDGVDKARVVYFTRSRSLSSLPPTSDALCYHIQRSHYQAMVWLQACCAYPNLPEPTALGWKVVDGKLTPELMSLPAVPESCIEVIACSCKTRCSTDRCKCRKSSLLCTGACKCHLLPESCLNVGES